VLQVRRIAMGGEPLLLTTILDVTARQRAERQVQGVARLLELSLNQSKLPDYLASVVRALSEWTGCQHAGIRLHGPNGALVYAASVGFPPRFLDEENRLGISGEQCPCVQAAGRRPESALSRFITDNGSFFCGSMSQLLSETQACATGKRALPCVQCQFESVAHVRIRSRSQDLGFLHLADVSPQRFPPETIRYLETVAPLVAETVRRFQAEDELRDSEKRFRTMFESHDAVMLLIDPGSGAIVEANRAATLFYGRSAERLSGASFSDLGVVPPGGASHTVPRLSEKEDRFLVLQQRTARRGIRTVEIHSSPIVVGGRKLLFAILHDITERKQLQRRIAELSDQERQQIGLDLHDSLGGHLAGTAMQAKALARRLQTLAIPEASLAEEVMQSVNQAVSQARSVARGLCPVGLQALGLRSGLEALAASMKSLFRVSCELEAQEEVALRDEQVAMHLYRIAQEAVNNAIRHARARHIRIRLAQTPTGLSLQVVDDGRGLPKKQTKKGGMGLHTMRFRAEMIGAHLEITPGEPKGTVVSLWLPNQPVPDGSTELVS